MVDVGDAKPRGVLVAFMLHADRNTRNVQAVHPFEDFLFEPTSRHIGNGHASRVRGRDA